MENLTFQIHLGSYDGTLMGFQGTVKSLENNYSFAASNSSIKTLCVLNKYLFAGGFDEIIKVFNLNKMREDGQLEGHEGSITCMKGFKNFLFSGGEDGNILVWKTKEWGLLHKLQAHSKSVLDLAIHSSGKIMISIGKEQKLILWNLLNFQKTFTRKFSYEIFKVRFNCTEDVMILMGEKKLHLLNIETNKMLKVFEHEQKIHDFLVYGEKYLISGDELGDIFIRDISLIKAENPQSKKNIDEIKEDLENEEKIDEKPKNSGFFIKFKAHEKRIKQMQILKYDTLDFLITCSSDGFIKIWDVLYLVQKEQIITESQDLGEKVQSVFKIDSRERICCMEINALKNEKEEKHEKHEKNEKDEKNQKNQKNEKKEKNEKEEKQNKKEKKIKKGKAANKNKVKKAEVKEETDKTRKKIKKNKAAGIKKMPKKKL